MRRILYTFLFVFILISTSFATHERAGEIIYRHIQGLTYEAKIITYTYRPSPADRPELTIEWGDGTFSVLPRTSITDLTPLIRRNEYIGQHTYAGAGTFIMSVEDPNRNYGIVNIPNSVNVPFYIQSELVINPFVGSNNSVVLLNPPLDYGCVNKLYVHNPAAYDPDGDSLSYKLTICRGANGDPIPGYTYPQASIEFFMNENTGDLVWNTPVVQGEYNVAFIIEEWRNGFRVGYVTRDLQIQIGACNNEPPEIFTISDTCVTAGETLIFDITAIDPDGNFVILTGAGGPLLQEVSPAQITPNPAQGYGSVSSQFVWETDCAHVRKNPYNLFLKAKDSLTQVSLTAYKTVSITVVSPAPVITEINPVGTSIHLQWEKSICENAAGYHIYRKDSFYGFVPGPCETGVPGYTGYIRIATLNNINHLEFEDNNNGAGLIHGIEYCYMITAFFTDGAESYASEEWCATLRKDIPVITNVSIEKTGIANGEIFVAWSKPTELDSTIVPPPYQYRILRQDNQPGSALTEIAVYFNLNDTLFNDEALNTRDLQYRYRIDFYNGVAPDVNFVGSTVLAPSIYLQVTGTDKKIILNWNNNTPWINEQFVVYRQNNLTLEFDSIGISLVPSYVDTGLINGDMYCYKIETIGKYSSPGIINPIINFSQENCGTPVDNVPPCPPVLDIMVNCIELKNELTWIYPDTCEPEDDLIYYIYYAGVESSDFVLIDSTTFTDFTFATLPPSVVGCFAVTALDSLYNQSFFSNVVCVDINECGRISFPIVFTPNGDGYNDFFQADSVNSIHKLRLKIFNRWGAVVYETDDPFFEWNGKDQDNNRDCSPGVYFFEGVVSEYTLIGPIERKFTGSVTLLR
ncbi:MAG: gliding motility-associated C-terminal domain-containing protein [Bacteroidales bacterium]